MKNVNSLSGLFVLAILLLSFVAPIGKEAVPPKITKLKFGTITIDGTTYEKDMIVDKGKIRQRKKGPSKEFRSEYGHTPLTEHENNPWDCEVLVVGKGMSSRLPITKGFKKMAKEKGVKLIILETPEAVEYFSKNYEKGMNAIFHITC